MEEYPASILTFTVKIKAVCSFQMVAPTNKIPQHHDPKNEMKMSCCRYRTSCPETDSSTILMLRIYVFGVVTMSSRVIDF
jgi:hypothetical protein